MGRPPLRKSGIPYTRTEQQRRRRKRRKREQGEARFAPARERRERARADGPGQLVYLDAIPEVIPDAVYFIGDFREVLPRVLIDESVALFTSADCRLSTPKATWSGS